MANKIANHRSLLCDIHLAVIENAQYDFYHKKKQEKHAINWILVTLTAIIVNLVCFLFQN